MNTAKKKPGVLPYVLCVAVPFAIVRLLSALLAEDFGEWNSRVQDKFFGVRHWYRGCESISPDIVHVNMDDSSYELCGNELLKRGTYARILRVLEKAGVRACLVDVMFAGPTDPAEDADLAEAAKDLGCLYMPLVVRIPTDDDSLEPVLPLPFIDSRHLINPAVEDAGDIPSALGFLTNMESIEQGAAGTGHITCNSDSDGVYRRYNLIIRHGDGYIPSLALRLVCDVTGADPNAMIIRAGKHVVLTDAEQPDGTRGQTFLPIDTQGRMIVNFAGPWYKTFTHYSAHSLLEAESNDELLDQYAEELQDSIVILSDVSTHGQDFGAVPLERVYPKSGIHSSVLNSILTGNLLAPLDRRAQTAAEILILIFCVLLARRLKAVGFATAVVALVCGAVLAALCLFVFRNVVVSPLELCLSLIFAGAATVTYKYQASEMEKSIIRNKFEHYFTPAVLDKILRSPDMLENPQRKELTVMFTDISGFTSWSSTQLPAVIHSTLNEYFHEMTRIVFRYEGTVDKFIGDGLMVFFGDPGEQPDHALRAVQAGVDMQRKARELKARWKLDRSLDLKIRVGINTGEVAVGNMGTAECMDYTVIGAHVNLAQRMESIAPVEGVLCTESVWKAVAGRVPMEFHGESSVKGLVEKIRTYRVVFDVTGAG